jgi:hypothetical protein
VICYGSNLEDSAGLIFHDQGIALKKIEALDAGRARCILDIATDAPLGTHPIRVRTRSGLSNLVLFSVGNLNEIRETEPNNDPASAPTIELGTTINGTVSNEDIDYYAVNLEAGGRIAVEVEALRLGGPLFDPKLKLFDPEGHEVLTEDDTCLVAQDAAFVHVAEHSGRYLVAISEAAYGGADNYCYRLHIGKFPRPLGATPLGGVGGATAEITWLGDPGLSKQIVSFPAKPPRMTTEISPKNEFGEAPTPMRFRIGDKLGTPEIEPNDQPGEATTGPCPGGFEGVIGAPGDQDWFQFEGAAGQSFDVRVWARELGSPLDSVLKVTGPNGADLLNDDDSSGMDSSGRITLAENGFHRICVRDHLGRGGPLFTYRVEVNPVEPALDLSLLENKPAQIAVPRGNRAFLLVSANRHDFGGPLSVHFSGMPPGVTTVLEDVRDGESAFPVVIQAASEAVATGALVDMTASLASTGGPNVQGRLKQDVVLVFGVNETVFWQRRVDRLALAVTDPAPYEIEIAQPRAPIVRNGTKDLKVQAKRNKGFDSPIDLRIPWLPSGVGAGTATIPAGATAAVIHMDANSGAAVGVRKIAVTGASAGHSVCSPFADFEVAEPWVSFEVASVETERGKPAEMMVKVTQLHDYTGTFKADLLGFPGGIATTPQDFSHGTSEIRFPMTVAGDAPVGKHEGLFIRAIIEANGEQVLHQSGSGRLTVFEPLPQTLQQQAPPPAAEAQPDQPQRKTRFPTS